jgi:murein DD-endopeptidase MepM/ murein hydrolase activator NlpD
VVRFSQVHENRVKAWLKSKDIDVKKPGVALSVLFLSISSFLIPLRADHIREERERWKIYHRDVEPTQAVTRWNVPFKTVNRGDLETVSVISTFGAPRLSYVRGHFHTGVDMIPKHSGGRKIYVYPMAAGVVCSIHLGDPHRTVVVKHRLANEEILYTSYKHLQEVYVSNGQAVTPETSLARLYTREEARALGGRYDHLHLEVRKKFDDYGVASWATMNKTDLDLRFLDPWKFMKEKIK